MGHAFAIFLTQVDTLQSLRSFQRHLLWALIIVMKPTSNDGHFQFAGFVDQTVRVIDAA